jgi:integrase
LKEKLKKIWLTTEQVDRMLAIAKLESQRDYLMLLLMRYGLRCGEIVGTGSNLGKNRGIPGWTGLPGIRREDLRHSGIWVKGKGYEAGIVRDTLYPLLDEVMSQVHIYATSVEGPKLFDISELQAERVVKKYARLAGVEDWDRVGPHRLRAYYNEDMKAKGIDIDTRREMMRHAKIQTTELYQRQHGLSFETKRRILETLDQSKQTSS